MHFHIIANLARGSLDLEGSGMILLRFRRQMESQENIRYYNLLLLTEDPCLVTTVEPSSREVRGDQSLDTSRDTSNHTHLVTELSRA